MKSVHAAHRLPMVTAFSVSIMSTCPSSSGRCSAPATEVHAKHPKKPFKLPGSCCFLNRFGAYLVLSIATCLALDWVTGPQKVATLPDAKQLELVREAAEQRRAEAQARLQQKSEGTAKCTGANLSRLSKLTRRNSHSHSATAAASTGTPYGSANSSPKHSATEGSSLARISREGSWGNGLIAAGVSSLNLVKGVFRSSDPGEVFSPKAVRINMEGPVDFVPITLVFQDLRWVRSSCGDIKLLILPSF